MNKQTVSIPDTKKQELLDRFLRFGLISKGIVYCLFGIIAVMAAAGLSKEKASKTEALNFIYEQPFGQVILMILLIGMLGYVTLRLFQCFKDTDQKGSDMKGMLTRAGYGISALLYIGLGVYIVKLLMRGASSGGDSHAFIINKIFNWPTGQWIIGIVAVLIIANGFRQIHKGVTGRFMRNISLIRTNLDGFFRKSGMMGYAARGVVLLIIGYLFLHAAITVNPSETKGTEQAFAFIENNFGSLLMGIVALGLVAYGIFMFVKAKYQQLNIALD